MALPKLDVPIYTLKLPSSGKEISYRPFLVKEEKILLMAMEGGDEKEITTAIKQIINNCVVTDGIDVSEMPLFDIEYVLLNLRARSMGDVVKTNYVNQKCEREDCKSVEIEIDLSNIEVTKDKNHNKTIQLTKDVSIVLKYPNMEMIAKRNTGGEIDASTEDIFEVVSECIDMVIDGENIYSNNDMTKDEKQEFIESFTSDQFKEVQKFFDTMPKMYKDIEFNCEKCGYKEDIRIEGLAGFFT